MVKLIDASDPAFQSAAKVGAFKGAVTNLNNNDYHSLKEYWSSSELKFLSASSPLHFYHNTFTIDPKTLKRVRKEQESEWSGPKTLGSLAHCLILEPQNFDKDFFVMPDLNLRTNDGKAKKEELLIQNAGKIAVTDEMLVKANGMRSSVSANAKAMELLLEGKKEAAFFWTCKYSGLNFKAKLDNSSSKYWMELKTSWSASPEEFSKIAYNLNYDLSIFHYRMALQSVMEVEPQAYFLVVESDKPHVCQLFKVGDDMIATGHSKWFSAVDRLKNGTKDDHWPGYTLTEEIPILNPPYWAMKKLDVTEHYRGGEPAKPLNFT